MDNTVPPNLPLLSLRRERAYMIHDNILERNPDRASLSPQRPIGDAIQALRRSPPLSSYPARALSPSRRASPHRSSRALSPTRRASPHRSSRALSPTRRVSPHRSSRALSPTRRASPHRSSRALSPSRRASPRRSSRALSPRRLSFMDVEQPTREGMDVDRISGPRRY